MGHEVLRRTQRFNWPRIVEMIVDRGDDSQKGSPGGVKATTDKRDSVDRLRESEATLAAILAATVDAIITIDPRGLIDSVNPACERIFGYSSAELVGQNVKLLMAPPDREKHDSYISDYLSTGQKKVIGIGREVVGQRKDGSTFPMEIAVSEVRLGKHLLFTGILRDITERKRAEEALKKGLRQQAIVAQLGGKALVGADLQDLTNEAVSLINKNLEVEFCKVLELLPDGKELLLIAGVGWKEGLVGHARVEATIHSQAGYTLLSSEPVIVENLPEETRFKSPRLLYDHQVVSGISVTIMGAGKPYGVLGAHTTKRRTFSKEDIYFIQGVANVLAEAIEHARYHEELVKQESLARVGAMAAVVAHEVKNPIAGIVGALRMLHNKTADNSLEREMFDEMIGRLMELNNTVDDILVFARPRTPNLKPIPIGLLLEDTVSLLSEDPQFSEVEVKLSGPDVNALCDAELLRPVFLNLLVNAAQAMEGQGEISVSVDVDDACCRDGCFMISFKDNGPGIQEDVGAKVFEPFFSTKGHGTGLGLPIAKRVIELHGGEIAVDSPPGGGARFTVRLPLDKSSQGG